MFYFFMFIFISFIGGSGNCVEEYKEKGDEFKTPTQDRSNLKTECDEPLLPVPFTNFDSDEQDEDERGERSFTPNSIEVRFNYDSLSSEDSDEDIGYIDESNAAFTGDADSGEIAVLNVKIARKIETEINYPNLYIAHYRGLHYLRDRFQTTHARRVHVKTSHINQTTHSPAVYDKTCIGFGTPIPLKQQMSAATDELTRCFEKLSVEEVVSHWNPKVKDVFISPERRLHQRLSNNYDGYRKDVNSGQSLGMDSPESPYVAAADAPYHALRYAFGLKLPTCQRPFVFSPDYRANGKPRHSRLGKILIFVHSLPEYAKADAEHIPSLGALGEISPQTRALDESETTFKTLVAGKYIVLEEIAKVPSLAEYKPHYKKKYGLTNSPFNPNRKNRDLKSFNTWRNEIIVKAKTAQEKREAENEFMDIIAQYQAKRIFRKTKNYINQRSGKLVYKKVPVGYSLDPANLREARELHKKNFPKMQKDMKSKLAINSPVKPQSPQIESFSQKLFPSFNPQFYYENNSRYYFRTNEDVMSVIFQRFLSHRSNRYVRHLLVDSIRKDWEHIKPFLTVGLIEPPSEDMLMQRNIFKIYFNKIKNWKNGIDRQMVDVLSHIWNFGAQTCIIIYEQNKELSNKLEFIQEIGSREAKDFLYFLKISESEDYFEEYLPLKYIQGYNEKEVLEDFNLQRPSLPKHKDKIASAQVLQQTDSLYKWIDNTGTKRIFSESYVDGSKGNCGFTAIGMDREDAIQLLINNAENSETRRLIAPEIRALVTDPEEDSLLPPILQELQQRFHHERGSLVEMLEAQRATFNEGLGLTGENAYSLEAMQIYSNEHQEQLPLFNDNYRRLQEIDEEMNVFIPTAAQLKVFVNYEFGEPRHAYLSYFRGGGGALEAIARLRGIEVTVLDGVNDLTQTLHVPSAPDNHHRYFLHHVGGVDSIGRVFLNHFNLLEDIT